MNISSIPAASPVDTNPVGLENRDQPNSTLKPVERAADSAGLQKDTRESQDKSYISTSQASNSQISDRQASETVTEGSAAEEQRASGERQAQAENLAQQRQLEQDRARIKELSARDREVRTHEQAHAAVGGQLAGSPKYQFERGPDGVNYAVSGEVPIDVSKGATPEEAIARAATVRRAALAPAEPSPQDRSVAAQAAQLEAEARQEMRTENLEEQGQADESAPVEAEASEPQARSSEAEPENNRAEVVVPERPSGITVPTNGYISSQSSSIGSLLDSIV